MCFRYRNIVFIGLYLVLAYFKSLICFFWRTNKFWELGLYLSPHICDIFLNCRHGECYIWEFLVLAFIETGRLNTTSFTNFFLIWKWQFCPVNYICQVSKWKLLSWRFLAFVKYICSQICSQVCGTVASGDCRNCCFFKKHIFKTISYLFILSKNQQLT